MSARAAGWQRAAAAALLAALVALVLAVGIQKIRSFDYWWHLRTGALIAETGSVPKADPFTWTVEGARWIDIHWLFQVGLHGLHALGGHDAVVWGRVAHIALLCALVGTVGFRRQRPAPTVLALALMLLAAGDRFMPRPELPSFVLLAAILALLERHDRRGDAWVFAVLPLQVLWANVHGLFALGIAVCAIYAAAELLRPFLTPGAGVRRGHLLRLAALLTLCLPAALLNPNGLEGALYPVQQLGMIGPEDQRGLFGTIIAELIPPLDASRVRRETLWVPAILAALAALAMLANWRRVCGAHPLLWVAFGYLALGAQRNLALFAIVCAPILVRNANEFLDHRPGPARERARAFAGLACAALVALAAWDVASGRYFPRMGSAREPGFGVFEFFYPVRAVDWIERERPPGPIAHHMGDGGYLIWRLWPDYRAMADGRLEVYGPERFARLTLTSPEAFRALDEEHRFGVALIHYSLFGSERLFYWLYLNSNWRLVSLDESAALFVRVGADGSPRWPEVDVDAPELFPPRDETPRGSDDYLRRMARVNLFTSLRRYPRALDEWEALLGRYPDEPRGPVVHAMLLARTGKTAAAETILRRLLEERGDDPTLLTQVGELRQRSGDLAAARELYDRALALDPRHAPAALQRAVLAEHAGDHDLAAMLYARVAATTTPLDPLWAVAQHRLGSLAGGASGGLPDLTAP